MDAFYGEIRIFGFTFPPENWAQCNGQSLQIGQYQGLLAVIGFQFGGDGRTTFQLPNLQGSAVCQSGSGPGLTPRVFGKTVGVSTVSLNATQMPPHQHDFNALAVGQSTLLTNVPTATSKLARTFNQFDFTNTDTYDTTMAPQMVGVTGSGAPHENRQPYLAMNVCICLYGEYPVKA